MTLLALSVVLSYLLGSFPTALALGRAIHGKDLRDSGSGNSGATNAFRVFGWKLGLAVAAIDLAKGALAAGLVSRLADPSFGGPDAAKLLCGAAAVLGHVWTVFARFRGGKGIATSAGAILVLSPPAFLSALILFALTLGLSGIVSLSSFAAALGFSAGVFALHALGRPQSAWILGFAALALPFVLYTHRANLIRLFKGQEKTMKRAAFLRNLFKPRRDKNAAE